MAVHATVPRRTLLGRPRRRDREDARDEPRRILRLRRRRAASDRRPHRADARGARPDRRRRVRQVGRPPRRRAPVAHRPRGHHDRDALTIRIREHTVDAPQINPGEIANWPILKLVYRTDPEGIADLLPPGIEPGAQPHVHVNLYNVPVKGEPEYGVSTKVVADYQATPGYYGIGLGIDQESAIFISQELNGQPKFPCSIVYFRRDDAVVARCTHQGYTFLEFNGEVTGVGDEAGDPDGHVEHDWWIKSSRAVGGVEKSYD